ncbi:hypothetical protein [Pseudocnuella soli]|uniref:hypothetical protein n=1 Tax=Pseudocnuella soli TaxID=2502779 RepID=UPI00104C723D|nr:hypothetical protein [Pseudocnuella soli]
MTYPAGFKFSLERECDEILQYLYSRRYDGKYVDLDIAQTELPFPFEVFEIATQKLYGEGLIELSTDNKLFGKITEKGSVFCRTSSFQELAKDEKTRKKDEAFDGIKSKIEVIVWIITILLSIYSIYITNKVDKLESKIEQLEKRNR